MTALLLRPEGAPAPELPTLPQVPGEALWSTLDAETLAAPALEIAFQSFKDGRGFTLARELRDRLGYQGWLRASGDLLPDQATHLWDVGFDDVLISEHGTLPAWERAANRFKRRLQRTAASGPKARKHPRGKRSTASMPASQSSPRKRCSKKACCGAGPGPLRCCPPSALKRRSPFT